MIVNGAILGVFWVAGHLPLAAHVSDQSHAETIGPICTEVAGLGELPSMLSLAWLVIVLPTTCKFSAVPYPKRYSHAAELIL